MNKIVFYVGSMKRGGAQRVLSVILNRLIEHYNIILITDVSSQESHEEYFVDSRIKHVVLCSDNVKRSSAFKILSLRKIIKKESPDAVVSFLKGPNFRNIIASFGIKTKIIVSVRNDPNKEYGKVFNRFVSNLLFMFIDKCVFQTQDQQKYFPFIPQRKRVIIPNPVDEVFFNQVWLHDKKEIVVVGRLEKQKNPFMVLHAFNMIHHVFQNYSLHYYGRGSLTNAVSQEVKRLGLENKVFLHGEINYIHRIIAHSCMYIMCSDYEGMPNALMEAMAVGAICISTDCPSGGPAYLLSDIDKQLLVSPRNVDELADRMKFFLESPMLCIKTGEAIKEKAQSFRPDLIVDQWRNFLFERTI